MNEPIDSMVFEFPEGWGEGLYEPVYGDPDYDYGYADDGTPIPPPCPVCGAWAQTCTSDIPYVPPTP